MKFSTRSVRRSLLQFLVVLGLVLPVYACESNDGPIEEIGEDIDEAVEEVGDEIDDATDGN